MTRTRVEVGTREGEAALPGAPYPLGATWDGHGVNFALFTHLMQEHPVLRRRNFFQGRRSRGSTVRDIMWLVPSGREMTDAEWDADHVKCLGVRLAGGGIGERDGQGQPLIGETLLYLLNADEKPLAFTLPTFEPGLTWRCLIDTFDESREARTFKAGDPFSSPIARLRSFRECRTDSCGRKDRAGPPVWWRCSSLTYAQ